MGFSALKEGRVTEIRELNGVDEANAMLKDGWELFTAVAMTGPGAPNPHRYVRYVLVKRQVNLNMEGL